MVFRARIKSRTFLFEGSYSKFTSLREGLESDLPREVVVYFPQPFRAPARCISGLRMTASDTVTFCRSENRSPENDRKPD